MSIPSQSPFSCPLITPAWAVSMATKSAPGLYTVCLSLCFLFSLLVFFCSVGASQPSAASLSVRSLFYLFIYLMILPFFFLLGCDVEGHFFCMRRWAMFVMLSNHVDGCVASFNFSAFLIFYCQYSCCFLLLTFYSNPLSVHRSGIFLSLPWDNCQAT